VSKCIAQKQAGAAAHDTGCNAALWRDKQPLATTTLFWGVSGQPALYRAGVERCRLGYSTTQASSLVGVVAISTAVGAVLAIMRMQLEQATLVMPLGIANRCAGHQHELHQQCVGGRADICLGGLGECFWCGARCAAAAGHNDGRWQLDRSTELRQACILALGAGYSLSTAMGLSSFGAITAFSIVVAVRMVDSALA
jgi:hypothetical protein